MNDVEKGAWRDVEDTEFLFFDGTASAPLPKRTVANANYLSSTVRIIGSRWLRRHGSASSVNRDSLVKASPPEFLYLLSFGAALVAT